MLGTRSAGELPWCPLILEATLRTTLKLPGESALRPRCKARTATRTTRATLASAIEDRTATLNAGVGTRHRCRRRRRRRRSFVHRPRPGLRHNHLARLNHGSSRSSGNHRLSCRSFGHRFGNSSNRWRNCGSRYNRTIAGRSIRWRGHIGNRRRLGHSGLRWRNLNCFSNRCNGSSLNFGFRDDRLDRRRNHHSGRSGDDRRRSDSDGRNRGWLDHHGNRRRRNGHSRPNHRSSGERTGSRTGNHRSRWGTRGDRWRGSRWRRRSIDDRRSLAWLRHNPARLGTSSDRRRRNITRRRRRGSGPT
jgi:hypothetical protein